MDKICLYCRWWDVRFFGDNAGMCYNLDSDEFRTDYYFDCKYFKVILISGLEVYPHVLLEEDINKLYERGDL